jgi:hypothetical protein
MTDSNQLFNHGSSPASTDADQMLDANADELTLKADEVIPFPREHSYLLHKEFINVFDVGCVIALNPGSGEVLKAILTSNVRGVAACKTTFHKKWLMNNLHEFTKIQRLVTLDGKLPPKPSEVLAWENDNSQAKPIHVFQQPPPPTLIGAPPSAAVAQGNLEVVAFPMLQAAKPPTMLAGFGAGKF